MYYMLITFFLFSSISSKYIYRTLHINRPQGKAADTKQTNKNDNNESQSEEETESDITPNYNHVKLVWLKPTDKRAPFIAIPVAQAPDDFLTNEEKYKDEIFVVRLTLIYTYIYSLCS